MPVYLPLTERLEIQELVISANTYGEQIETWQTIRIVYASQLKQKGKLYSNNYDQYAENYLTFFCRYTPMFLKGTRILYNCNAYKVWSINNTPRNANTIIELINYT